MAKMNWVQFTHDDWHFFITLGNITYFNPGVNEFFMSTIIFDEMVATWDLWPSLHMHGPMKMLLWKTFHGTSIYNGLHILKFNLQFESINILMKSISLLVCKLMVDVLPLCHWLSLFLNLCFQWSLPKYWLQLFGFGWILDCESSSPFKCYWFT